MADGNSKFHSLSQKGMRRLTLQEQVWPALIKAALGTME